MDQLLVGTSQTVGLAAALRSGPTDAGWRQPGGTTAANTSSTPELNLRSPSQPSPAQPSLPKPAILPPAASRLAITASDKLFNWMFQAHPGWISHLLTNLAVDPTSYLFSASIIGARC